jgi:hypothetical protein
VLEFDAPDLRGGREAVEHGHLKVHQDEIQTKFARQGHRLGPVGCHQRLDPHEREPLGRHHQIEGIVVDHQDQTAVGALALQPVQMGGARSNAGTSRID